MSHTDSLFQGAAERPPFPRPGGGVNLAVHRPRSPPPATGVNTLPFLIGIRGDTSQPGPPSPTLSPTEEALSGARGGTAPRVEGTTAETWAR